MWLDSDPIAQQYILFLWYHNFDCIIIVKPLPPFTTILVDSLLYLYVHVTMYFDNLCKWLPQQPINSKWIHPINKSENSIRLKLVNFCKGLSHIRWYAETEIGDKNMHKFDFNFLRVFGSQIQQLCWGFPASYTALHPGTLHYTIYCQGRPGSETCQVRIHRFLWEKAQVTFLKIHGIFL